MLLKCCTQYVSKFGKLISGHRTGKGQFSFQSQRRVRPKNVHTTVKLHLLHMLVKVMFKIFQATLQQYLNEELTNVPAGSSRSRQRNQRSNCQHLLYHRESKGIPEKKIYFCFTEYAKAFDGVHHNKLWKNFKEMGIPDHLTCLLRILYVSQVARVRTRYETLNLFKIGKGVFQGYILSLCLFNLYADYIMQNARLDEPQTGIKIARRNINNLRHADDTTLMAERKEELRNLLMRVQEESEKNGLNSTFSKLWLWHLVPSLHGK